MLGSTDRGPVPNDVRRLYWDSGGGLHDGREPTVAILAADSWLVTGGMVRAVERHRVRFTRSCTAMGMAERVVDEFWEEALAAISRNGDWFPRVELLADGRLSLLLRPAPRRGTHLRVLAWDGPDPRTQPRIKGPDLGRLAEIRGQAVCAGADEALLRTRSGLVTESTTSALLWWEDDDLCLPSRRLCVLPSVTAHLLVELARGLGVRIRWRYARVEKLDGRETWLVNALHGVRTVSEWTGSSVRVGAAERAPRWRTYLESLQRSLADRDQH